MKETQKPAKVSQMTLANRITILRIVLTPVIVIGLLQRQTTWVYALLVFSMLTDLFDGIAARARGERTRLGAFLDPMADKLLLTALYITLTYLKVIEVWVFVIIFSRDLLIVLGWGVIYILTGSSKIVPRMLGKVATAIQMATAFAYILGAAEPVRTTLLIATILATTVSAIDYVFLGSKSLGA